MPARTRAFSLIEVLVATTVFLLLLAILGSVMTHTIDTVRATSSKLDAFQAARTAMSQMRQKISGAILNTYLDYDNALAPTKFTRKSDLHFLVEQGVNGSTIYFQSPRSASSLTNLSDTTGLLNACGFYLEYGSDLPANTNGWHRPPHVQQERFRYRLMQAIQPAEDLAVYQQTNGVWTQAVRNTGWPLAENVIGLIVWPKGSEQGTNAQPSSNYLYDSRAGTALQQAQLPPSLRVTMVIIDERSAQRYCTSASQPAVISDLFQGRFANVANYDDDLRQVQQSLTAAGIRFEVLTGDITLRESRWSQQ